MDGCIRDACVNNVGASKHMRKHLQLYQILKLKQYNPELVTRLGASWLEQYSIRLETSVEASWVE